MRDDKSFPYILLTGDHCLARHLQASRRALAQGRLFRPVRLGRAVGPHHQFAAARLPAAHLHGLRSSRAARGRACSIRSSAAPAPAPARSRSTTMPSWSARRTRFPVRPQPGGEGRDRRRHGGGGRRRSISSAPPIYRDRLAALSHVQSHQGINRAGRRRGRRLRHPPGGRPGLHPGVLLPHRPELGQPRLFPEGRPGAGGRRGARLVPGAVLRRQAAAARCILLSPRVEEQELLAEALATSAGRKVDDHCAAARREEGPRRPRAAECARGARRAGWPRPRRKRGCSPGCRDFRPRASRRAASRSTTTRTSWAPTPSARWSSPGRKASSKNQYRKFNIRSTEITPGDDFGMMREVMERRFSRLLKEARAAGDRRWRRRERGRTADEDDESRHDVPAWPDLDPDRRRPAARCRRVRRRSSQSSASRTSPSIGIAKGADRDAGRETFFMPGREPFSLPAARPRALFRRSGCATRRTASPSARTARAARRRCARTRSTRSPASARPASARCSMHFGTAKAISRAALADLAKVHGISAETARQDLRLLPRTAN